MKPLQGKWVRVKVNDQFPVDDHGQLLLVRSAGGDELWPCLLEKAYAKYYQVRGSRYNRGIRSRRKQNSRASFITTRGAYVSFAATPQF